MSTENLFFSFCFVWHWWQAKADNSFPAMGFSMALLYWEVVDTEKGWREEMGKGVGD
jgi:hypothetical protein